MIIIGVAVVGMPDTHSIGTGIAEHDDWT